MKRCEYSSPIKGDIKGVSGVWLRSFLATEMMGWHEDNLVWKDQDEHVRISLEDWKPDKNWEHFGLVLDLLPDKDWSFWIFIAEGGGWICETHYENREGVAGTFSFCLAACIAIAKAMGWN